MKVSIAHDYVTQRGGAERVVLSMLEAFQSPPLYTSLFLPEATFPEFRNVDVRTLPVNCIPMFRKNHRLAFPLLASSFSRLSVDADVVICSSTGWAHGLQTEGRKVVYCNSPARWLYQTDRYLGAGGKQLQRAAVVALRGVLTRWDQRAARSADRYLANSTAIQKQIEIVYGIESEIVLPPCSIRKSGPQEPVQGLEEGFYLCVSRLLPYKNVRAIVEAFETMGDLRLVVVGEGPDAGVINALGARNIRLLGRVSDDQLRWLYANCSAVVAASYEDYGLTPIEGAVFGKPAVTLRYGGYLDTVQEGLTGIFFDGPDPKAIACAVRDLPQAHLRSAFIEAHAERFSVEHFAKRLNEIAFEEVACSGGGNAVTRQYPGGRMT